MQKAIMMMSIAAIMGWSQPLLAGESQNPHDPVNQADESDLDIRSDTTVDTGEPNPNSLGRTGRIQQIDQNTQRNRGIQTPPNNFDNIDDRIETINDRDRELRDRLDGSPVPTAEPDVNSDRLNAEPIPPGQGPAVNPDSGTNTGTTGDGTSTGDRTSTMSGPSSTSGSGSVSSGTSGGSATGSSGSTGAGGQ